MVMDHVLLGKIKKVGGLGTTGHMQELELSTVLGNNMHTAELLVNDQ
jgi:hypothetical protein